MPPLPAAPKPTMSNNPINGITYQLKGVELVRKSGSQYLELVNTNPFPVDATIRYSKNGSAPFSFKTFTFDRPPAYKGTEILSKKEFPNAFLEDVKLRPGDRQTNSNGNSKSTNSAILAALGLKSSSSSKVTTQNYWGYTAPSGKKLPGLYGYNQKS